MILGSIVGYSVYSGAMREDDPKSATMDFASKVDLSPLDYIAVHADGRLRSFESHAKTYMGYVSGPRSIDGHSYGFTYLDLMLRPERYTDVPLIYVKNKLMREEVVNALSADPSFDAEIKKAFRRTGLLSRTWLERPQVVALLQKLGRDLIRTAKPVDAIHSAMTVANPRFLSQNLRLVAPPTGDPNKPWLTMDDVASVSGVPDDHTHAALASSRVIPGLDDELRQSLASTWSKLKTAWQKEDAQVVNEELARVAELLPTVSPTMYPTPGRLSMESWYFRTNSMTWIWLIYLASVVPLLMSAIYKWDRARVIGMALFVIAFAFQTASVGIRWYISGRWPNANMFEAVTTSAWFGGLGALILERLVRKTAFRSLFALGSAVVSMAALMAAYFLPVGLDSAISNKMAALNDVWLYIHTNVIIWSYAVIGIACIPALLLLRERWCQLWDARIVSRTRLVLLPIAIAVLNYTGYALFMHVMDAPNFTLQGNALLAMSGAFWGSLMLVILEAFDARARRKAGLRVDRGASGGASAIILGNQSSGGFLTQEKPTTTQVYDGATMVLVELSFIMLWAGLVMGAIWADHSWGRPWGWDPKETFALNTFLIFLILIHVRLKVKDKAFWTAVIAVIGFEVMMFNWIVVNFVISGLHSYA